MKQAPSYNRENYQNQLFKKHKIFNLQSKASIFFYSSCIFAILFTFIRLYQPENIEYAYTSSINIQEYNQTHIFKNYGEQSCDLFKGQWIEDTRGSLYTNYTCKTIPFKINCFLHGRNDREFLNWRWKPDKCELPRFDPIMFLSTLQGKTMAFIGDSISRNQMESLLCLLSMAEAPNQIFKDTEDRFTTWEFPNHNFTLMALWSQFLVNATERTVNGSSTGGFNLYLDKIDNNWSEKLPSIDYAIFSDAHWFFRSNYLYESGKLIGCVYCQEPNVIDLGPTFAIGKAFKLAFHEVNNCKNCRKIVTLLRTFSPSHFEGGSWNNGGGCNKTRPIRREEVNIGSERRAQGEEIEIARSLGEEKGNKFELLDITEIMAMRADGHPGLYWGNRWMKGYSDCIHWCLPGPIDLWNELLLEVIKKKIV